MPPKLTLYGTDLSQPCRAVSWALRAHDAQFDYVHVMPGSKKPQGTRHEAFLKELNPNGTVPVLVVGERELVLPESNAILVYLAETLKWDDVWPANDVNTRAKIMQWMSWAPRNSREFTIGLFAPVLRPDLRFSADVTEERKRTCKAVAKFLDSQLDGRAFLVPGHAGPTLADNGGVADIGQTQDLGVLEIAPYKHLRAWLTRMRQLKGYEETHEPMMALKPLVEQARERAKASSRTHQANM